MNISLKIPVRTKRENGIIILYNTKYNISGYGKTARKAREMFVFCVKDVLTFKKK